MAPDKDEFVPMADCSYPGFDLPYPRQQSWYSDEYWCARLALDVVRNSADGGVPDTVFRAAVRTLEDYFE